MRWPENPTWVETDEINNGNQYAAGDGIVDNDMNSIIENLLWLKNNLGGTQVQLLVSSAPRIFITKAVVEIISADTISIGA